MPMSDPSRPIRANCGGTLYIGIGSAMSDDFGTYYLSFLTCARALVSLADPHEQIRVLETPLYEAALVVYAALMLTGPTLLFNLVIAMMVRQGFVQSQQLGGT